MPVKNLQEILKEIMREGRKSTGEWKAITAPTPDHFGSDILVFHPINGPVFQVRAYEKNPFQIEGVGSRISRKIDEDFLKLLQDKKAYGNMGIVDLNYRILEKALQDGKKIDQIFLDAVLGRKDQGIDFVNLGDSYTSKSQRPIPTLNDEQKKLDKEYKRLIKKDGKTNMYG
ncbi:MAG: hypothetical protein ACTSR2_06600 [Candidatus Hodarchaeales archaeon]